MLKLEHLQYNIRNGSIKPRHFPVDEPALLTLATELLELYRSAAENALPRWELENLVSPVIRGAAQPKTAAGLNKLLIERSEFAPGAELDYPALRREKFLQSGKLLKQGIVTDAAPQPDLYGDLPEFENLQNFKPLTPQRLLEKYNMAQAQGLICHTAMLKLHLSDPENSELRRVMKAIKFFRLLAQFTSPRPGTVEIDISGPYTLFGPTAKYATSLAALLPVLCRVKKWSLEADIRFKERELILKLSDKNGLVSPGNSFSSYIPEEIRLYHKLFAQKSEIWIIAGETPFIDAGDQQLIFPDLSFVNSQTGQLLHLELFHRWHQGQLESRLKLLNDHPGLPLFIGIDRALVDRKQGETELRSRYPEIADRLWFFRDFPGVENTLRMLKKLAIDA